MEQGEGASVGPEGEDRAPAGASAIIGHPVEGGASHDRPPVGDRSVVGDGIEVMKDGEGTAGDSHGKCRPPAVLPPGARRAVEGGAVRDRSPVWRSPVIGVGGKGVEERVSAPVGPEGEGDTLAAQTAVHRQAVKGASEEGQAGVWRGTVTVTPQETVESRMTAPVETYSENRALAGMAAVSRRAVEPLAVGDQPLILGRGSVAVILKEVEEREGASVGPDGVDCSLIVRTALFGHPVECGPIHYRAISGIVPVIILVIRERVQEREGASVGPDGEDRPVAVRSAATGGSVKDGISGEEGGVVRRSAAGGTPQKAVEECEAGAVILKREDGAVSAAAS